MALITLFLCFFIFDKNTLFPGANAIAPTLATVLLIYSGVNNTTITYRLLCLPISIFIGNISYSFYLWHWPVIIFYKYSVDFTLVRHHMLIVLLIAIFCGYFSYKYIENPLRSLNKKLLPFSIIIGSLVLSGFLCILMLFSIDFQSKNISDDKKVFASYLDYEPGKVQRLGTCFLTSIHNDFSYFDKDLCVELEENKANYVLIGDSHAAHWYSSLRAHMNVNQTLTQVNASGCKPILSYEGHSRCTDLIRWAYESLFLSNTIDTVILSARWTNRDIESLKDTILYLEEYTRTIIVLGPILEYEQDLPRLLAVYGEDGVSKYNKYKKIKSYDDLYRTELLKTSANYISVIDIICEEKKKCISTVNGNIPLQFDYGHLTGEGANLLMDNIKKGTF